MTKQMGIVRSEFIEKTGLIAQNQGIPRVAGRVLGMLLFDGDAVAFGDLARELQVSRGSISTSTRLLEDRALIKRLTKPGERQDFFQLAENPFPNMLARVQQEMARAQADIQASVAEICDSRPDVKARVQDYANLYASLSASVQKAKETL
ncbi:GbsR/MarR family transcriptional regulator [Pseudorhodobacter ferrugineus]|uniref:GbsR/MarR family transcriptional regulator n=1 Tax=Pseudorhodobacter ferrugineus TaxID=77008 RepID=UPI0003B5F9EA|nr:MarR family transcriptional regulator [Pseudorhodobacter ferrugineus]